MTLPIEFHQGGTRRVACSEIVAFRVASLRSVQLAGPGCALLASRFRAGFHVRTFRFGGRSALRRARGGCLLATLRGLPHRALRRPLHGLVPGCGAFRCSPWRLRYCCRAFVLCPSLRSRCRFRQSPARASRMCSPALRAVEGVGNSIELRQGWGMNGANGGRPASISLQSANRPWRVTTTRP
jgi:hypothetical protein